MKKHRTLCVLLFSLSSVAPAAEYERWLFPITVNRSNGLRASKWSTVVYGLHTQDGILVRGFDYDDGSTFAPPPTVLYFGSPYFTDPGESPGHIVYIPKESVDHVHLTARLWQEGSGRVDQNSLPVVREREFVSGTIYFLGMDKDPDERLMLRVYSLDLDRTDAAVRVRIVAPVDQFKKRETILDGVLALSAHQRMTSLFGETFAVRPLAAELPLDGPMERAVSGGPILITVTPEVEGLRIWGFISETDNATNRVQIITPQ